MVEQRTENPRVAGSIPAGATRLMLNSNFLIRVLIYKYILILNSYIVIDMSLLFFFNPKQNVVEEKNHISLVSGNTMHKHDVHLKSLDIIFNLDWRS